MKQLRLGKKKMKMNNEFVPFEIAKRLKDVGFDETCLAGYQPNHKNEMVLYFKSTNQSGISTTPSTYGKYCHQNNHVIKAPLYQQVFGWLNEVHNIYGWVERKEDIYNKKYYAYNYNSIRINIYSITTFDSFIDCQNELLNEMLNHLEKQNKTHIL